MTTAAAAAKLGFSKHWGHDRDKKRRALGMSSAKRTERKLTIAPPPKAWDELTSDGQELLRDFNLFRTEVFLRDPVPWATDAANRTVEWLLEPDDVFGVMSEPPGSGKSTLFTHDLVCWLLCGGGALDPAFGRSLRIMIGSHALNVSTDYVRRIRATLEDPNPFWNRDRREMGKVSLVETFGRFKPDATFGDEIMWSSERILVAQVGGRIYEKEPTVFAAAIKARYIGQRANLCIWDDPVDPKSLRLQSPERTQEIAEDFEDEAESRCEPGGCFLVVGQRLGPNDLYRSRMDATYPDENGDEVPKYRQIVYPAHNEATCENGGKLGPKCRQWDAEEDGCLLDAKRLGWKRLLMKAAQGNFRTVYQQEDANPEDLLVQPAWIYGGKDFDGFDAPGCLDHDRTFWEWPAGDLITYACVDPSASNYWAIEVKAYNPHTNFRYLIYGVRKKMRAGTANGFLDYDPETRQHVGAMEEIQRKSGELGNPIQVWVIEANAAHQYLHQTFAYELWRKRWPLVSVIPHVTGRNKNDPEYGVDAALGMVYRQGLTRLPYAKDVTLRNYLNIKIKELTTYPQYPTDDTIMADWFGENRIRDIMQAARRLQKYNMGKTDPTMPTYVQARSLPPALQRG